MKKSNLIVVIASIISCSGLLAQNINEKSKISNSYENKRFTDSVNREVAKYSQIDYLRYNYKYLDENLKIDVSSEVFDSILNAYNFYSERIQNYKDSISVILAGEFDSEIQRRIAKLRITKSWLRVSYYLWISETETKTIGEGYGFQHPHDFYDYIYYRQSDWDNHMKRFVKRLKKKVFEETENSEVYSMPTDKFLDYALKTNPTRIKSFRQTLEERRARDN